MAIKPKLNRIYRNLKYSRPVVKKIYRRIFSGHYGYLGWQGHDYINMNDSQKRKIISSKVNIGEIEINKNCNLNCLMCKSSDSKRPNLYMNFEVFQKVCTEMNKLGQNITKIYTIGEPLLNPHLESYFQILKKHNIKAVLSTNGQIIDRKMDLLVKYSDVIHSIRFSVDGATQKTYEKIRVNGSFEKLINNLNYFSKINHANQFFPNVMFDSMVNKDTLDEIAQYFALYSKYTDIEKIGARLMNGLCPDNTYFFETNLLPFHTIKTPPCYQLFDGALHILCDGSVTACCRDYHGDLIYGNISADSAYDVINNQKIKALRDNHLNDEIPVNSICNNCFKIDSTVSNLFSLFVETIVHSNRSNWDVPKMQKKFNSFFDLFSCSIPDEDQFLSLCLTEE